MTEQTPKPSILVIIPPPVWALVFIIAAGALGLMLGLETPLRHRPAGFVVFALGFLVAASGRLAFAKVGTEVHPASKKNSALVTSGPFRFTRNPMYLGIVIAMTGLALLIGTWLAFGSVVLFFAFVNWISIPYEEAKMERQFGDDYRAYKLRVRRWI
jgi:protein-S-isoprenylcysteine O-methyltransferase Ste14